MTGVKAGGGGAVPWLDAAASSAAAKGLYGFTRQSHRHGWSRSLSHG